MSTTNVLDLIAEIARNLSPSTLNAVAGALEASTSTSWARSVGQIVTTPALRERIQALEKFSAGIGALSPHAIALALRVAAHTGQLADTESRLEISWTGPGTDAVPTRRVDQVVYEMLESSREELLLVTYAAYKAERALSLLKSAANRGVRVRCVLELASESGGKISFDGLNLLRSYVPCGEFFFWPLNRRPLMKSGAHGTMHAKCLIADSRKALVSSANLTDHALEANMELGLIVEGLPARRIAEHFNQLIARGDLIAVT